MEKAEYAGIRLGSYIFDAIIVNVIVFFVDFIFGFWWDLTFLAKDAMSSLLGLAISAGYFTYFFGNGQTLGMKAVEIKLCGTDGTYQIGYGKDFIRWIGMIISGLMIGLGYLWILIDKNNQGWHDKIADTYVVVGYSLANCQGCPAISLRGM